MKLFFLTHHKCGSAWFNKINFDLLKAYGRAVHVLNDNNPNYKNLNDFYIKRNAGMVSFNNADPSFINFDDNYKAIHIVRDPRDIIVSGYFSHKKVHPLFDNEESKALEKHRKLLNEISLEDGLLAEIEFSKKWYLNNLVELSYILSDKILRLKLENISSDYKEEYKKILTHFELGLYDHKKYDDFFINKYYQLMVPLVKRNLIPKVKFRNSIHIDYYYKIMDKFSWQKMTKGREKGNSDTNSHYRKGVAGDWVNYFNDEIENKFKQEFGDLVVRLGYEDFK